MTRQLQKLREVGEKLLDPELPAELAELFMRLFEDATNAIIVVDHDARIQFVNRKAESIFGYHRSELYDQEIEILIPESAKEKHTQHRTAFIDDPRLRPMGFGLPLKAKHKSGKEFGVEIELSPITIRLGSFVAATVIRKSIATWPANMQTGMNIEN